jgi:predicted TPR repeat methyltransferase
MEDIMKVHERAQWLQKVYNSQNIQELEERYDAWAEDYEQDVCSFGYKSPDVISGLIGRYVEYQDSPILDAGAGTGILGEKLASCGYKDLTGIDLSQAMLDVAHKKGVYQDLQQMVLGEHLDFPDNAFNAVVSMGVFTENHAPPESFDELIRITKPGGHVVFSVRSDTGLNKIYKEKQDALLDEGKWELVEKTSTFQCLPEARPEIFNQVFVYKVS